MELDNNLIKSNRLIHLYLNPDKIKFSSLLNKVTKDINFKGHKIYKPKFIQSNIINIDKNKFFTIDHKKSFANDKLKKIIKNNISNNNHKKYNLGTLDFIRNNSKKIFNKNLNFLFNSFPFIRLKKNSRNISKNEKKNIFQKMNKIKKFMGKKLDNYNDKETNLSISKNELDNNLRITSGMLNRKRLNQQRDIKITVNSFIINPTNKNILTLENDEEKTNKSYLCKKNDYFYRNIINSKKSDNNLNIKRYNKSTLLNNLFHKYSSINYSFNKSNICENYNSNSLSDRPRIKNKNIYMTNLRDEDKYNESQLTKISKRYDNILSKIKRNNSQIMNINKKIYINCLLSKVNENIKREKILLDKNKKTIFELDKESSYRRVKNFENIINKIYKKKS